MSRADAAGWARSRSQSVSVVPMIQWRPHGMTNSTLVAVRRIMPVSEWIRSFGTSRWMPLEARTWIRPRPAIAWMSSAQTPGGVDDLPAPDLELGARLQVGGPDPDDPFALAEQPGDAGRGRDAGAVRGGRPSELHGVPGVVDLRVPVPDRAHERVAAQRRGQRQRRAAGEVLVTREVAGAAEGVVEGQTRRRRRPAPTRGGSAGTGTTRGGRGAAPGRRGGAHVRAAPRGRARCRAARGSADRRG